jgi:hypothetical protein
VISSETARATGIGAKGVGIVKRSRWGLLVTLFALLSYPWIYLHTPPAWVPGADGHYNWLFARSLAYDGDVDLANDYALCGDPFSWNHPTITGKANNPYYIGPSVYFTPVLWVLRHLVHLPPGTPANNVAGCRGPLAKYTMLLSSFLGAATVFLSYRCARRVASDGVAALAAALFAFGSNLAAYAAIWPHYGHVFEAVSASIAFLVALRATEKPESNLRWVLAGAALGLATLQRPTGILIGVAPGLLALPRLWRRPGRLAAVALLAGVPAFLVGILPVALLDKYLFGSYSLSASKPPLYVNFSHAHPFLLLFAPRGGLFFWTPVAWIAVAGVWAGLRRRAGRLAHERMLTLGLALCFALTVYTSAAPLDWEAGSAYGARRLVCLVPVFVVLAAVALRGIGEWLRRRRERLTAALGVAVAIPVIVTFLGATLGAGHGTPTIEHSITQEELYGMGTAATWRFFDAEVGDVAVLPAAFLFSLRYGLPMNAFRDATSPWFARDSRTYGVQNNIPALNAPNFTAVQRNFEPTAQGSRMLKRRASIVFTASWAWATGLVVEAQSERPTHLGVGTGRAFGRVIWYGQIDLPGGAESVSRTLPIPPGTYDSGLIELVFESDDPVGAGVVLHGLRLEDTGKYEKTKAFGPNSP